MGAGVSCRGPTLKAARAWPGCFTGSESAGELSCAASGARIAPLEIQRDQRILRMCIETFTAVQYTSLGLSNWVPTAFRLRPK